MHAQYEARRNRRLEDGSDDSEEERVIAACLQDAVALVTADPINRNFEDSPTVRRNGRPNMQGDEATLRDTASCSRGPPAAPSVPSKSSSSSSGRKDRPHGGTGDGGHSLV